MNTQKTNLIPNFIRSTTFTGSVLVTFILAGAAVAQDEAGKTSVSPKNKNYEKDILDELYGPGGQAEKDPKKGDKENPYFNDEKFDREIKGQDESELSPFKKSKIDEPAKLYTAPHRSQLEQLDIRRGKDSKGAVRERSANVLAGYGFFHNYWLRLHLSKMQTLARPRTKSEKEKLDKDLLKGKRVAGQGETSGSGLEAKSYPAASYGFQPLVNYVVFYDRRSAESTGKFENQATNSGYSYDDFRFNTIILTTPAWRQKLLLDYFGRDNSLQQNANYQSMNRRSLGFGWQNKITSGKNRYSINTEYRHFRHSFAPNVNNERLMHRDQVKLDGQALWTLNKQHALHLNVGLMFFQNRSELTNTALNTGFNRTNYFKDNVTGLQAKATIYDRWQAIRGKTHGLDLYFGLRVTGAFDETATVGPYLASYYRYGGWFSWRLEYSYEGDYSDYYNNYMLYDYSMPAQNKAYLKEHIVKSRLSFRVTKKSHLAVTNKLRVATNYPDWQRNVQGLYTINPVDATVLESGLSWDTDFSRHFTLATGVRSIAGLSGADLHYQPVLVPYLEPQFRFWGFLVAPSLQWYSEQRTNGGQTLDGYFAFDLRIERQIFGSLEGFIQLDNILDVTDRYRAGFETPGFVFLSGIKLTF